MTNDQIAVASSTPDSQEDAAFWFARLRSDACTEEDQQQFDCWLAQDPSHDREYDQYCSMWSAVGELAEEPEIVQLRLRALAQLPEQRAPGRWRWPALAASILIMVMIGFAVPGLIAPDPASQSSEAQVPRVAAAPSGPPAPAPAEDAGPIELATSYRTAIGEHSAFTLPDGSVIELNTNSQVRVTYTAGRRDFDLLRGEAIFRVAKNKQRPFVVQTNDNRVTALGTVFAVRRDADQTTVTLLEGKVKVEQFEGNAGNLAVAQVTNLLAGQQLQTSRSTGHQVRYADTEAAASWAEGRLYFENRRLGEVVAELNRYTAKRLVLGEASLADLRISGQFRTSSADTFAQTLAVSFPVEIAEDANNGQVVLHPAKRKNVP